MGFDDGKYYQNCNLICVAPSGYNGKSVQITDGSKSYSATVANNIATFMLPGRTQYTVKLMNASSIAYQTTVELGYGECVELHLETGYEEVIKKELMSLDAIKAATGDLTKSAPNADAVKNLSNESVKRISGSGYVKVDAIGYDSTNKQLKLKVGGADSVINFNSAVKPSVVYGSESTRDIIATGTGNVIVYGCFNYGANGAITLKNNTTDITVSGTYLGYNSELGTWMHFAQIDAKKNDSISIRTQHGSYITVY